MQSCTQIARLLLAPLLLFVSLPALAGALPPCVKAVSSNNGSFLVISDTELGPPDPSLGNATRVQRVTLQVYPREEFIVAKDRLTSPETFWTISPQWSVVLDSRTSPSFQACPLAMITEDGEFLLVLNEFFFEPAMQIYRRRGPIVDPVRQSPDRGVFVKAIALKELWPADKLGDATRWDDHTPQWFAGGNFEFSSDSRSLLHTTRWASAVRINLLDGSVAKVAEERPYGYPNL